MSQSKRWMWSVDFSETPYQSEKHPYSITEQFVKDVTQEHNFESILDGYCMSLLLKLKDQNKYQRKEFILYQIEHAHIRY